MRALLPNFPGPTFEGHSIQSYKLASTNSQKDLDHRIYFLIRQCDRANDEWHTGSLHTGEFAQLGSDLHTNGGLCPSWWMGVAGNVAPLWCSCKVAVYRTSKTKCIRDCDWLTLKHMTNINDREYGSYNRLCFVWSRLFLYFILKLVCPVTSHIL